MLYIFHGTDENKSGDKARNLINSLRTKKPDAFYVELNSDNFDSLSIEEHFGGQGLFSNKYIIFINKVAGDEVGREKIIDMLPAMKESANIFILYEGKINAELKKAFEKNGEKVVISDLLEQKIKKEFNIFALADAIGLKDGFKAWSLYREALENGLELENILGTIFWQLKSMIVASRSKSANEAGLNPFVFSKAKKACVNYKEGELKCLLKNSLELYHDGHRGIVNLELGIEKMLLKI